MRKQRAFSGHRSRKRLTRRSALAALDLLLEHRRLSMARDDAATTFLFGPSTTLLLGVYIQKNESWHLWCDVALVWFFRFCCISTGKAADLSTGYSLFRGFLLRAGCMGVRCAGSGRTTQRYVARQDVAPGVRLVVVLSVSYRHGPGAVKSG